MWRFHLETSTPTFISIAIAALELSAFNTQKVASGNNNNNVIISMYQCLWRKRNGLQVGMYRRRDILLDRRQSLFGHIARLDPSVPANAALQLMVNSHEGKKPSTTWTSPCGRPRRTWLKHIQDADARPLSTIWRSEVARGHGGAQRSVRTSR